MNGENERDRNKRRDDFWDLEQLLPPTAPHRPPAGLKDVSTVPIRLSEKLTAGDGSVPIPPPDPERLARAREALRSAERRTASPASPPRGEGEEVCRITDCPWPLIKEITVYPAARIASPTNEPLFAAALAAHRASPPSSRPSCPPLSAVFPHYSRMDGEQMAFYLWWREQIRHDRYPDGASAAHVTLLSTELINLSGEVIGPSEVLAALCALWEHYGSADPRLDYLFPEWITDLCLLHSLPLSPSLLPTRLEKAVCLGSLKEFFLSVLPADSGTPFANAVLRYGCNYRYRDSRFLTEENKPLFDTHVPAAFLAAMSELERTDTSEHTFGICSRRALQGRMTRHTFHGSGFAPRVKHRLEVDYLSCSRSVELRFMATDLLKYCENQVRRICGIKSRFHTSALDPRLKAAADAYFAPLLPRASRAASLPAKEAIPEYEALYEAHSAPLSLGEAERLEESAWAVTRLLVSREEEEESGPPAPPPPASAVSPSPPVEEEESEQTEPSEASPLIVRAFALLLAGKEDALGALAAEHGLMPLTLLEQMNEAALDEIGDVAVEERDGGFAIIEDYQEDIKTWLNL